jgi:tRNA(fMet)-specific endonuclease VapC
MDTNHVTAWEAKNPILVANIDALPDNTLIYTSAITLGEIAAGHEMTPGDLQRRHQVRKFLELYLVAQAVCVSYATESYYAQIMGRIWRRTPPHKSSVTTDAHLVALGVNVNDVWITACALEHGLILLTSDKMTAIKDVTPEVQFENWCEAGGVATIII